MTQKTADEIRDAVSAAYGARARAVAAGTASGCCGDDCCGTEGRAVGVTDAYYAAEQAAGLPETVVSYGCGNPVAIGTLRPGEVVLDLGSGAGLDCFLAARQVGPFGRVFGLDMTDDMLSLAEQNKAKLGDEVATVSFHKGTMEAMPVPDAAVDVIISNCVINLSPDKDAVFREAFRVLRPGGRLHVSDVVLLHALSAAEQQDMDLWAGCVSGALVRDEYQARLAAAGFTDVAIEVELQAEGADAKPWQSALITAYKPGAVGYRPDTSRQGETIALIAVAGLEGAACCGPDCCEV
jgi:SAM-dependent methyltransferase